MTVIVLGILLVVVAYIIIRAVVRLFCGPSSSNSRFDSHSSCGGCDTSWVADIAESIGDSIGDCDFGDGGCGDD